LAPQEVGIGSQFLAGMILRWNKSTLRGQFIGPVLCSKLLSGGVIKLIIFELQLVNPGLCICSTTVNE
jgi:hypothetical protein